MALSPTVFRQLDNVVSDLQLGTSDSFDRNIKKLARVLHGRPFTRLSASLKDGIDIEAWVKAGRDKMGSFVGSGELEWPDEPEKELGTVIALIDWFAEDPERATQFSYDFYYIDNNFTTQLRNLAGQVIVPFARDFAQYAEEHLDDAGDSPIVRSPEATKTMAVSLTVLVSDEIKRLEAERPNDPDRLDLHNRYIDFLQSVALGLAEIAVAINAAQSEPDASKKVARYERASEIASQLGSSMMNWIAQNKDGLVHFSASVGLLGAGTAFLSFCGVPNMASFAASALLLGGSTVKEMVDTILKHFGKGKG